MVVMAITIAVCNSLGTACYSTALLSAVPIPDPEVEARRERIVLRGEVPSPLNPPAGSVFHPRCPIAVAECAQVVPALREVSPSSRLPVSVRNFREFWLDMRAIRCLL